VWIAAEPELLDEKLLSLLVGCEPFSRLWRSSSVDDIDTPRSGNISYKEFSTLCAASLRAAFPFLYRSGALATVSTLLTSVLAAGYYPAA
jgi:hypothetical protein